MSGPPSGRHLGRKLADIMADTHVKVRTSMLGPETAHRAQYHKAFMEEAEAGLAERARAVFGDALTDPDLPDEARRMFEVLTGPEHQSDFIFGLLVLLGAVFTVPGAAAAGIAQQARNTALSKRQAVPLTVQELAMMVVRGVTNEESAAREASFSGLEGSRFGMLVRATGNPPGPQELLEAFRRGYIDAGRLHHGIRQSNIKDEWIDVVERLRFAPPGAGTVVAAAVQGHLGEGDASRRLGEAGIDPANFRWMYETAGRPPGTEELIHLLRRGEISEGEVVAAIRESDVKNKYIPAILRTRRAIPPMRTIVAGVHQGVLDAGAATAKLRQLGYEADDAAFMVREGLNRRTAPEREIAKGEVLTMYLDAIIDRPRAADLLHRLHYPDDAVTLMLSLADARRARHAMDAAVGRVRTSYIGHHVDRPGASTALDHLGVPSSQRDQLIGLWDVERGTNVRQLTEVQIVHAWRQQLIDDDEFRRRHVAMGYTDADAELLWRMAGGGQQAGGGT